MGGWVSPRWEVRSGSFHDDRGDHAEHPVVAFHVVEDVTVPHPGARFVGADQHRVALARRHIDGVGKVRVIEREAVLGDGRGPDESSVRALGPGGHGGTS